MLLLLVLVRNAGANEVVQHGACLGLGLAAMGTANEELYDELKVGGRGRPPPREQQQIQTGTDGTELAGLVQG